MIHDILAIQAKYGADPTTRADDTVYGFHSTADRSIYDFSQNLAPNLAIYDAGGNDTLDMSGANAGVFIDLRPGSFSSGATRPTLDQANAATAEFNAATDAIQGDFALWTAAGFDAYLDTSGTNRLVNIYNATGVSGVMALSYANISIAYNTIIENAVGSSERDYLIGNHVANVIQGMGGDDVLMGLAGNDTLDGGDGTGPSLLCRRQGWRHRQSFQQRTACNRRRKRHFHQHRRPDRFRFCRFTDRKFSRQHPQRVARK